MKPQQNPSSPRKFNSQDFRELRASCLSQGLLFEDATFPAHFSSIGATLLPEEKLRQIQWKRPTVSSRAGQLCSTAAPWDHWWPVATGLHAGVKNVNIFKV
uniref:Calpain catalytic domain-containing protein n=1 Tax=Serinus canaria TaxID=9135 RepID=A0A8C9NRC1_SERCA